jgi:hypothetical protein
MENFQNVDFKSELAFCIWSYKLVVMIKRKIISQIASFDYQPLNLKNKDPFLYEEIASWGTW